MRHIFSRAAAVLAVVFLIGLLAVPVFAQDKEGPTIDPTAMEAILIILSGGVVTLVTQLLKNKLGWTGFLAQILSGVIGIAVVGVYFLFINPPFELAKFALYAVVVFGEATGLYHFYQKRTA
jgi:uncharacterized membrane protein YeaQ/YmgE (transglycosylase-associated protein family)